MMAQSESLRRQDLIRYSFLATPLAFAGMPLYIHAPDFYAAQFGAPLATIGIILLCLRCFDAVQDPLIGLLSDRFSMHRRVIITAAALLLVASFFMLFSPSENNLLLWFTVSMLFATTAFSVLSINLNTLGGLWSRDAFQKTRITTFREAFGLVGLLLAVILPAVLMQSMPAVEAFKWVAAMLLIIMLPAIILFRGWYHSQRWPANQNQEQQISSWAAIKQLPKATRKFFIIYAFSMLASSLPALLVLFYIRDLLGAEEYTGLFLLIYFLAGIAGMPIWQRLSKQTSKANAWMAAMLLAIFSFVWAYNLGAGDIWQYALICLISGIAFGADLALPPSMLADHIQQHQSQQNASIQFGLFAFIAKAALALASFIGLTLLDYSDFTPAAENTAGALLMLSALYALIPCIIKFFAVFLLWQSKHLFEQGDSHETRLTHPSSRSRHHAN